MNIDENRPFSIGTTNLDAMNIDVSLDERIKNRRKSLRIPKPRKMIDVAPRLRKPLKKSILKKKNIEATPFERSRGSSKAKKNTLLKSKRNIGSGQFHPSKKEVREAILQEQGRSKKALIRISKQLADGKLKVISRKNGVIQLAKPEKPEKDGQHRNAFNGNEENGPSKKMIRNAVEAMKDAGLVTKGKRIVISFQKPSKEKLVTDPNANNTFVFNGRGQIKEVDGKKSTRSPKSHSKGQLNLRRPTVKRAPKGINVARGSFPLSTKQSKQRSTNARQNKFNQKRFLER